MAYLRSLIGHLWTAFIDLAFVSLISLTPLLLGRLQPFASGSTEDREPFWAFLTNGQLAFYSMGSLAVMLVAVFRKKLPTGMSMFIGTGSVVALLFLSWLIGIDPELQNASVTFVGVTTLYLYLGVQLVRVIVDAAKQVDAPDALRAGEQASDKVKSGLEKRKGVPSDV